MSDILKTRDVAIELSTEFENNAIEDALRPIVQKPCVLSHKGPSGGKVVAFTTAASNEEISATLKPVGEVLAFEEIGRATKVTPGFDDTHAPVAAVNTTYRPICRNS